MTVTVDAVNWQKVNGLLPVIVQDCDRSTVLMMGYMNPEALSETLITGNVVFYSRTRQRLWMKGESSGYILVWRTLTLDCDQDSLLVQAKPQGPVCHLGTESCYDNQLSQGLNFLAQLDRLLDDRRLADPNSSYTARLMEQGLPRLAQKVGEEAVETALAAVADPDCESLLNEAADLLFHLMLLLKARGLTIFDIANLLGERHRQRQT